jgi:serine/threonine-protein kinase
VDAATGIITTVAGTGQGNANYYSDNRPGTEAFLYGPTSITIGKDGNLYWIEGTNNVIRRLDLTTNIITTILNEYGERTYCCDGGPALTAKVNLPNGLVTMANGNLVFGDENNHAVRELSPAAGNCPPPAQASLPPQPPPTGSICHAFPCQPLPVLLHC